MATNFKIFPHRNSDNLHLKLLGDFDGSSAKELVNALKVHMNIHNVGNIYIHTNSLHSVHPFGLEIFQKDSAFKNLSKSLKFTGKHGETFINY